ncbi:MAG: hypothetical protein EBS47_01525 [Betaproteobacteria bacterium]|nr:hypothetical protein [Betaproteobacteria bacterium]
MPRPSCPRPTSRRSPSRGSPSTGWSESKRRWAWSGAFDGRGGGRGTRHSALGARRSALGTRHSGLGPPAPRSRSMPQQLRHAIAEALQLCAQSMRVGRQPTVPHKLP